MNMAASKNNNLFTVMDVHKGKFRLTFPPCSPSLQIVDKVCDTKFLKAIFFLHGKDFMW